LTTTELDEHLSQVTRELVAAAGEQAAS